VGERSPLKIPADAGGLSGLAKDEGQGRAERTGNGLPYYIVSHHSSFRFYYIVQF
jgi:hypothetical protein